MKTELIIALLGMACIGSLAAFFVAWAKADEYKRVEKEEHDNYLSAKQLHNTVCGLLERSEDQQKCSADAVMWYAEMLMDTKRERDNLQDRLSALRCPHNDHVWEVSDAYRGECRCKKCGRMKDALP